MLARGSYLPRGQDASGAYATCDRYPTAPIIVSPTGQIIQLRGHDGLVRDCSVVLAVTRKGYAAGYSTEGGCQEAVAWLSHPASRSRRFAWAVRRVTGITPDQVISGTGSDANQDASSFFAFVASRASGFAHLPGLGKTGETSTAVGINAGHHILGTITSSGVTHVVIWNLASGL